MFNKHIAILTSALLLVSVCRAEMIAFREAVLNKKQAFVVELSDKQRALIDKTPSECEIKGARKVLISVANTITYPRAEPFASGCWYYVGGKVIIAADTLHDNKPMRLSYLVGEFKTTPEFLKWDAYALNAPVINKPLTEKEKRDAEIIATGNHTVNIPGKFVGRPNVELTDVQISMCNVGEKKAVVSGCVEGTGRCVRGDMCWSHSNGVISLRGELTARDRVFPMAGEWPVSDFEKSKNFIGWDHVR